VLAKSPRDRQLIRHLRALGGWVPSNTCRAMLQRVVKILLDILNCLCFTARGERIPEPWGSRR
jgi:hypothetical protein